MNHRKILNKKRNRRALRTRAKLFGSASCPRLAVFRSNRAIYAQIIDDEKGRTLVHASSLELKPEEKKKNKTSQAELVGKLLSSRAAEYSIKTIIFDRRGYRYHGRVAALSEVVKKSGIKF